MKGLFAFCLMMSGHYLFCPPISTSTYQEGNKSIKIEYGEYWDGICWPSGMCFVIHYETSYDDGTVANRTFEWKSPVLRPHHKVLKLKLRQTTRDDDRKAIKALLKSFGCKTDFLTDLENRIFNPGGDNLYGHDGYE